jgi:hypothetical protein
MHDGDIKERTKRSIALGMAWLLSQEQQISKITDFAAHYKAPYLMAVTGQRERSAHYANLLEKSYLREDGDFRMSAEVKGWQHMPASPGNRYIYGNGWAIAGLQKIGAYGAVAKALPFIQKFQDPKTGGFCSRYDIATQKVDPSRMDTSSTCSALLALLACGRFEAAVKAGDFLVRMIEDQPQKDKYFFTTYEAGKGIFTDVFHNEDATAFNSRKHYCVSTEKDALYEIVWFLGMPMKLLGNLFDLTGDRKYLEAADAYFQFFNKLSEGRWHNNSGTKIMWGAAELYALTGREDYRAAAERYLTWLLDSQHEQGVWVHSLWYKSLAEQPFQATLDLVQEYISEFSDVLYSLSRIHN